MRAIAMQKARICRVLNVKKNIYRTERRTSLAWEAPGDCVIDVIVETDGEVCRIPDAARSTAEAVKILAFLASHGVSATHAFDIFEDLIADGGGFPVLRSARGMTLPCRLGCDGEPPKTAAAFPARS